MRFLKISEQFIQNKISTKKNSIHLENDTFIITLLIKTVNVRFENVAIYKPLDRDTNCIKIVQTCIMNISYTMDHISPKLHLSLTF